MQFNGETHFAQLGSSWPGEPKMSRKLVHSFGHLAVGLHHLALCARWPKTKFSISARWWNPTARRWKTEFSARWPKLCTNFRDIFGSPGQEEPSWAKWVSPLNSSVKTTTFKPNLYFYHRIPLNKVNIVFKDWCEMLSKQKIRPNILLQSLGNRYQAAIFRDEFGKPWLRFRKCNSRIFGQTIRYENVTEICVSL